MLLIIAFLTSYFLQERKIEAVHETVISIFAGSSLWASVSFSMINNSDMCCQA